MSRTDTETATERPGRVALAETTPDVYKSMMDFDEAAAAGLDPTLAGLVRIRASQINGCAFCTDLHHRQAHESGESERRLGVLPAWRGAPFFTDRERAALALTEAVTTLDGDGVPDAVYEQATECFDETELSHLLWTIAAANVWSRLGVSTRMSPPETA